MLKDNSLADRLNAVKQGKPSSTESNEVFNTHKKPINTTPQYNNNIILAKIISYIDVFIVSLFYGVALKTIFNTEWSLFGLFSVGFFLNHILFAFPKILFPNKFK